VNTYFDSSALIAVYATERFSRQARAEARVTPGIPFTVLHELEVGTALRVLHGRGVLTARELRDLLAHMTDDRSAHRLREVRIDLFVVFARALELSARHASTLLCRSLDVLHVATALEIGCTRFVSGDDRQLALASAEGLDAVDVKRRRQRRGLRRR
jgi:predicted nucleic acid-binding protein